MTADELVLVAAVSATPADDTPRLVYADWLDEHAGTVPCPQCTPKFRTRDGFGLGFLLCGGPGTGSGYFHVGCETCGGGGLLDPDSNGRRGSGRVPDVFAGRAEFIRVQCELARVNEWCDHTGANGFCRCATCDHWNELWRRERELWGDPADRTRMLGTPDWMLLTIVPSNMDRLSAGWRALGLVRRGFVEEVRCSAADWLALADALAWRPGLTNECGNCEGAGEKSKKNYHGAWDTWNCGRCGGAYGKKGSGRVPRPCPPTAQPIRKVVLTAVPPGNPTWDDVLARFRQEWKWIEFSHA